MVEVDPILGVGPLSQTQYKPIQTVEGTVLAQTQSTSLFITVSQNTPLRAFNAFVKASCSSNDGGLTCSVYRNNQLISSNTIDSNYIQTNLLQGQVVFQENLNYLAGTIINRGEVFELRITAGASAGINWTVTGSISLVGDYLN